MERLIELGQLLDWYGAFLTPRQRSFARQYAFEDCSLSEIAEREGVSRQAVRDAIQRAERELRAMEGKLGLVRRSLRAAALLEALNERATSSEQRDILAELAELITEGDDGV